MKNIFKKLLSLFLLLGLLLPFMVSSTNANISLEGSKKMMNASGQDAGEQVLSGIYEPVSGEIKINVINEIQTGEELLDPEGLIGEMTLEKCDGTVTCKIVDFNKDGYKDLFITELKSNITRGGSRTYYGQTLSNDLYLYVPKIHKILKVDNYSMSNSGDRSSTTDWFAGITIDLNSGTDTSATVAIEYRTCTRLDSGRCRSLSNWKNDDEHILNDETLKLEIFTGGFDGTLVKRITYEGQNIPVYYTENTISWHDPKNIVSDYKIKYNGVEYNLGSSVNYRRGGDDDNNRIPYFQLFSKKELGDVLYNNIKTKLGGKDFFLYATGNDGLVIGYVEGGVLKKIKAENNIMAQRLDRIKYGDPGKLRVYLDRDKGEFLFTFPWAGKYDYNRQAHDTPSFFIGLTKNTQIDFTTSTFSHINLERKTSIDRNDHYVRGVTLVKTQTSSGDNLYAYYDGKDYFVVKVDSNGVWSGEPKIIRIFGTDTDDYEDNFVQIKVTDDYILFHRRNVGDYRDSNARNTSSVIYEKDSGNFKIVAGDFLGSTPDDAAGSLWKGMQYLNKDLFIGAGGYVNDSRSAIDTKKIIFKNNNNFSNWTERRFNGYRAFRVKSYLESRSPNVYSYYSSTRGSSTEYKNIKSGYLYSKATKNLYVFNVGYMADPNVSGATTPNDRRFFNTRKLYVYTPKAGGGYNENIYDTKWVGANGPEIIETAGGEYKIKWQGYSDGNIGLEDFNIGVVDRAELIDTDPEAILLNYTFPRNDLYLYGLNGDYSNLNNKILILSKEKNTTEAHFKNTNVNVTGNAFKNPFYENERIINTIQYGFLSVEEVEINGIKMLKANDSHLAEYKNALIYKDIVLGNKGKLEVKAAGSYSFSDINYSSTFFGANRLAYTGGYRMLGCETRKSNDIENENILELDSNLWLYSGTKVNKRTRSSISRAYDCWNDENTELRVPASSTRYYNIQTTPTNLGYVAKKLNNGWYSIEAEGKLPSSVAYDLYYNISKNIAISKTSVLDASKFKSLGVYNGNEYLMYIAGTNSNLYVKIGNNIYNDTGIKVDSNSLEVITLNGSEVLFTGKTLKNVTSSRMEGTQKIINEKLVFYEYYSRWKHKPNYTIYNNELIYLYFRSGKISYKKVDGGTVVKTVDLGLLRYFSDARRYKSIDENHFMAYNASYKYKYIVNYNDLENIKAKTFTASNDVAGYNISDIYDFFKKLNYSAALTFKNGNDIKVEIRNVLYTVDVNKMLNGDIINIFTEVVTPIEYLYNEVIDGKEYSVRIVDRIRDGNYVNTTVSLEIDGVEVKNIPNASRSYVNPADPVTKAKLPKYTFFGKEGDFVKVRLDDITKTYLYDSINIKGYELVAQTISHGIEITNLIDNNGLSLLTFKKDTVEYTMLGGYSNGKVYTTDGYIILEGEKTGSFKRFILDSTMSLLNTNIGTQITQSVRTLGGALFLETNNYYLIGKELTYNRDNKVNVFFNEDTRTYINKDRGLFIPTSNTYDDTLKEVAHTKTNPRFVQYDTSNYKILTLDVLGTYIINPYTYERLLLDKSILDLDTTNINSTIGLVYNESILKSTIIVTNQGLDRTFVVRGDGTVKNLYDGQFLLDGKTVYLGGKAYKVGNKGGVKYILDASQGKILLLQVYLDSVTFSGQTINNHGKVIKLEDTGTEKKIYIDGVEAYSTYDTIDIIDKFETNSRNLIFYKSQTDEYYYLDTNTKTLVLYNL